MKNINNKTGTQQSMKSFAEGESKRLADDKAKRMEESGFLPFYQVTEGTHHMEFADEAPVDNNLYAGRKVFHVVVKGTDYSLSISVNSPFYRDVINNLAKGLTQMRITRIGTGRTDTRYKVEAAKI